MLCPFHLITNEWSGTKGVRELNEKRAQERTTYDQQPIKWRFSCKCLVFFLRVSFILLFHFITMDEERRKREWNEKKEGMKNTKYSFTLWFWPFVRFGKVMNEERSVHFTYLLSFIPSSHYTYLLLSSLLSCFV